MQNITKTSKTKKVSTTYCFFIRKHLKFSISNKEQRPSKNNVHHSSDAIVFCYQNRVPVFISLPGQSPGRAIVLTQALASTLASVAASALAK